MALSNNEGEEGVAAKGATTPSELMVTVYNVTYPDPRRRSAGESEEDAVSRASFEFSEEARSFVAHNGGSIVEEVIPLREKTRRQNLGMLPGGRKQGRARSGW